MRKLSCTTLLLAMLAGVWPAAAEVTVRGDASDLTVEAESAPLEDVIAAVAEAVGSDVDVPARLRDSRMVSGVYQGSVAEVLKALAPTSDFIVVWSDGRVSVNFVDGRRWDPVAEAKPAVAEAAEDGDPAAARSVPGELGGDEPPTPARRVY